MKTYITISIDADIISEARKRHINISGTINQLLVEFLGPKHSEPEEEKKIQEFINFVACLNKNISFEEAMYIKETLNREVVETWKIYKEKFKPAFDAFEWSRIRKTIREFLEEGETEKEAQENGN